VLPGTNPFSPELTRKLDEAVAARGPDPRVRAHHRQTDGSPRFTNRLILETSPYLLQHAHNPVNWFSWGDEAFEEASRLGRPVFLSIGYSTCHWCHVMEEESFEDQEIATFLNLHYVAIKVDREERPDVDAVYMSAVQQLTGSGGWPMSVWLTAAREPFFGGTYFPPRDGVRGARQGFLSLLADLADTFHRDSERVKRAAAALVRAVRQDMQGRQAGPEDGSSQGDGGDGDGGDWLLTRAPIDATVALLKRSFDGIHGGLRRAPKFPSNVPVRLLLRHARRTGDAEAAHVAILTLQKMAAGGLYDQIGGGFHRYSTDAQWLVPHFEKMLYDNALLVVAYAEAFQVTGRPDFARVTRETCDYVLREMTDPDGGFYSATDADSEGPDGRLEEGDFFVWTDDQVRAVLGEGEKTRRFLEHYDVRPGGNWEGRTILNVPRPDEGAWAELADARQRLYEARARRPPPLRDEKILTSWNGLMISGLACAGTYPRRAPVRPGSGPRRCVRACPPARVRWGAAAKLQGRPARHDGFLDDYAFLVAGLIDLYEVSFDKRWLGEALALARQLERRFADPRGDGS
jgi:uncharacterized protein YyaL (SSP411 family)